MLRWTSKAGTENYGAASFTPVADGCDVEVKITYKAPRAIYAIVEGSRAQSIIRFSCYERIWLGFGKKMEGMFPEDGRSWRSRMWRSWQIQLCVIRVAGGSEYDDSSFRARPGGRRARLEDCLKAQESVFGAPMASRRGAPRDEAARRRPGGRGARRVVDFRPDAHK